MDKSTGKKQHTPNFIPKKNNKYHHGLLPTKRPRPAATENANKRRITTSSGVDEDIRLVLESAATDSELAVKIDGVKAELQAVDGALGDEGSSYLGIVDKVSSGGSGNTPIGRFARSLRDMKLLAHFRSSWREHHWFDGQQPCITKQMPYLARLLFTIYLTERERAPHHTTRLLSHLERVVETPGRA